jgi:hypothetical protein
MNVQTCVQIANELGSWNKKKFTGIGFPLRLVVEPTCHQRQTSSVYKATWVGSTWRQRQNTIQMLCFKYTTGRWIISRIVTVTHFDRYTFFSSICEALIMMKRIKSKVRLLIWSVQICIMSRVYKRVSSLSFEICMWRETWHTSAVSELIFICVSDGQHEMLSEYSFMVFSSIFSYECRCRATESFITN